LTAVGSGSFCPALRRTDRSSYWRSALSSAATARQWLDHSPEFVHVVAIDLWEGGEASGKYAEMHGRNELAEQFRNPDGPYQTFLSTNWEYRSRLTPVRGRSPEVLGELRDAGCVPDLVYLDSDKVGADIEVVHGLWPHAILTGDDWTWIRDGEYPIRRAVRDFARKHGMKIAVDRATWVLTHRLTPRERVTNTVCRFRELRGRA
jgi:hypothetical protein